MISANADANRYLEEGVMVAGEDKYLNYTHIWNDMPKKKKKEKEHLDYYEFHGKKNLDEKRKPKTINYQDEESEEEDIDEEGSELEEDRLEDPDYIEKRKKSLKKVFSINKRIKE
jgi:hypothetical protein